MLDFIGIRYVGLIFRPGDQTLRDWNDLRRAAWDEIGEEWRDAMRPKHFTHAGAKEYGFLPRSGEQSGIGAKFWRSYTGKKQRKFHHTLPLVWSGELRDLSRVTRIQSHATSSDSGTRVVMPMANKANFRNPHSKIDLRDELTRVSDPESAQLTSHLGHKIEQKLYEVRTEGFIEFGP